MNLNKRLLKLAQDSLLIFIITILFGLTGGAFTLIQAGLLSQIINRVFMYRETLELVSQLLFYLLGVILLRAIITWGSDISAKLMATRIKTNIRMALVQHLFKLGPTYTRGERTGELTNTLVEGVESLDGYYSQYLPQLFLAAFIPIMYLLFVFRVDLLSALVLLLTAPLIPLFMVLIGNTAQVQTAKQWRVLSRMSAYFLDVLQGLKTLKYLGRSKDQVGVIEEVSDRYRKITMRVLRVTFLSALALELIATLSIAVVAVEIGLRLLAGRMEFEQALFILLLAPEFYLPLRILGTRFHAGMAGVEAGKRILEILDAPVNINCGVQQSPQNTAKNLRRDFRKLEFDQVHFSYADDRWALKGVSFSIERNQKVALVGPSGGGKSTIATILLRFAEPQAGCILANGVDFNSIDARDWRSQIAWVSQNPFLFSGTVAENIKLARPNASKEEVAHAAHLARADEFIEKLPLAYETLIGERGQRLSAGQAQRIALARAFIKDSPILILDEPTANLDPDTEKELIQVIDTLLVDKTALIIAHRLNTTTKADKILVLNRGVIVAEGTHQELSQEDGLYRQLISHSMPHGIYTQKKIPQIEPDKRLSKQKARESYLELSPDSSIIRTQFSARGALESYGEHQLPAISRLHLLHGLVNRVIPYTKQILLSILTGFATIISGIGLMATSAYLISAAALQPSIAELQVAVIGVRFFGISRGLFRYLERLISHDVSLRVIANLRVWFYRKLEPLAPARLLTYHSGDLCSRIKDDIDSLQNFYVRVLAPPLVALLVTFATALFMWQFNPSLALILIFFMTLVALGVPLLVFRLSRTPGRREILARAALNSGLVEAVQGLGDILASGQDEKLLSEIRFRGESLGSAQLHSARVSALQNSLASCITNLCVWLVLVLAIPLVGSGDLSGVYLAVVVLAVISSFEAVLPLPAAAQYLESNLSSAARLEEVVRTQPDVQEPSDPARIPQVLDLEVERLAFSYPVMHSSRATRAQQAALQDISFRLHTGDKLAVVGPSGVGKSTLINLILRFFDYHQGSIFFGGNDLREYDSYDVRNRMAVVAQDSYLFNSTVRENLLIAKPTASEEEMMTAASKAQIHDVIQQLPQGYDTYIGEWGMRLSGGERQRLIIARAYLKDAPLLLLDEATAHLDALSESKVLEILQELSQARSVLLATHRLVGLDKMDEIIVLRDGRILEQGTHQQLIQKQGYYYQMCQIQNQQLA